MLVRAVGSVVRYTFFPGIKAEAVSSHPSSYPVSHARDDGNKRHVHRAHIKCKYSQPERYAQTKTWQTSSETAVL